LAALVLLSSLAGVRLSPWLHYAYVDGECGTLPSF
jgi:hypothetical protein